MSEQHTKEPWIHGSKTEHGTFHANTIYDAEGRAVCHVFGIAVNRTLEQEAKSPDAQHGLANASRIVACVNALAGIPTAQLPGLADEVRRLRELLQQVRTAYQRHDRSLQDYFDTHGVDHDTYIDDDGDAQDCPEDDTCDCPLIVAMNSTEKELRKVIQDIGDELKAQAALAGGEK